jgi:hypothetical protein
MATVKYLESGFLEILEPPIYLRGSVLPVRDWLRVAGRTQGCSFVYWVERVRRGTYERCCKNLVFFFWKKYDIFNLHSCKA